MCAGGVLAYLVLIPAIKFFGSGLAGPLAPGTVPISEMTPDAIRGAYVLYIGAGAVAAGGIVSLLRSMPTIWSSLLEGLKDFRGGAAARASLVRTDRDLSMKVVLIGSFALVVAIMLARPLHMNLLGAILIVVLGFLFVTVSSRLTGEIGSSSNPDFGHDGGDAAADLSRVPRRRLDRPELLRHRALGRRHRLHRVIERRHDVAGSEDRLSRGRHAAKPADRDRHRRAAVGARALGPILLRLNDAATVYVPRVSKEPVAAGGTTLRDVENFSATLRVEPSTLTATEPHDGKTYWVWYKQSTDDGPAGKYLVDDGGIPIYFVDPGINGVHRHTPDGLREVAKFDAPKATLMSYIIKGILNRQLPWGLVLLGVMIALTLEMSGVPSLAFAVGVYLPLSSSSPIFIGGMVRWLRRPLRQTEAPGPRPDRSTAHR